MKTVLSFLAGAAVVGCLCAASSVQKKWEIRMTVASPVGMDFGDDRSANDSVPDGAEIISAFPVQDGRFHNLVIVYRIPKK